MPTFAVSRYTTKGMRSMKRFLERPEAAKYCNDQGVPCTKNTLQKYATIGGGPKYRIFGNRALYTPEDIDAWIAEKLTPPRRSTSEA